ncbi:unnamed protein product [Symbiodinium natans]|uniref:Uncharacterized protein n=1 Tax=Symbiodinium natans TaxID=878477 RepID=A0A812QCB5_9DINO|nr:unnamed protein product [Symbiodinium natans]
MSDEFATLVRHYQLAGPKAVKTIVLPHGCLFTVPQAAKVANAGNTSKADDLEMRLPDGLPLKQVQKNCASAVNSPHPPSAVMLESQGTDGYDPTKQAVEQRPWRFITAHCMAQMSFPEHICRLMAAL